MKIIRVEGQSKVVEYQENGQLKRRILPNDSEEIKLGIPYGLPFALLLVEAKVPESMAGRIEKELHKAGLWTVEDLQEKPNAVRGAIQAAYAIDVSKLLNLARKYRR